MLTSIDKNRANQAYREWQDNNGDGVFTMSSSALNTPSVSSPLAHHNPNKIEQ